MYRNFRSPNSGQTALTLQHSTSPSGGYKPALGHNRDGYPTGGIPVQGFKSGGRVGLKKGGSDKNWIQKATKGMRKDKPCTGKKIRSKSCPPGSKRYNLAKTFKKMGKARKG